MNVRRVCLSKHYLKGSFWEQDIQKACVSYDTELVSWDGKMNLWGIHEMYETKITVASPGIDLSHIFPAGKAMLSSSQRLPLLFSCHLTCFHSSDGTMVREL